MSQLLDLLDHVDLSKPEEIVEVVVSNGPGTLLYHNTISSRWLPILKVLMPETASYLIERVSSPTSQTP